MENSPEFLYDFTWAHPRCRHRGPKSCLVASRLVPFMSPQQMNESGTYVREGIICSTPHISEIWIVHCIILTMSCSPSRAAFQAFCIAQHYSSGRSKETWARLLQGRTEWWKTIIWQRCISSIWNDSKLLLSLGTDRELGQATTMAVSKY